MEMNATELLPVLRDALDAIELIGYQDDYIPYDKVAEIEQSVRDAITEISGAEPPKHSARLLLPETPYVKRLEVE